jgi:hypothetical protein
MATQVAQESKPTGLAPLLSALMITDEEQLPLVLEFDATQAEPALEDMFLARGGTLAGAAARGATEFAVTGSATSECACLSDGNATAMRIPLPEGFAVPSSTESLTVDVDNRAKLLITGTRLGLAINCTLGTTVAGQGAIYLSNMMRVSSGSAMVPLTYANWLAHSSVVAATNIRISDHRGRRYAVNFVKHPERDLALAHAEELVGKWAQGAWALRTSGMIYEHSPTLTKSVAKTPCGVNDSGYMLVHDVLEMRTPWSWQTMNAFFANAVRVELEFVPEDIATFLNDTKVPGLRAAGHARTAGASLSMIAAVTTSYRSDGRSRVTEKGALQETATEMWSTTGDQGQGLGDCEDTAITSVAMIQAIGKAPPEVLAEYEYLNAVNNIVFPYYSLGVTVLGASGSEASQTRVAGAPQPLAGHAALLMQPTLSLLRAAHKGGAVTISGIPVIPPEKRETVAAGRLLACFPPEVLATLPEEERGPLERWSTAQVHATELVAYAVEGTTPASPILYATGKSAQESQRQASRDRLALAKAAPNVGRSLKILHVGQLNSPNPHMFYRHHVEFDVPRSHPLWSHEAVRACGAAATQFVFASTADGTTGATPREVVTEQYAMVPLVVANEETANILDFASETAVADVMPPRPFGMRLDSHQAKQLAQSLASLKNLDYALHTEVDPGESGHTVAYILAYNTLVNNSGAVEHFCNRLKEVAVSGTVDALDVPGMAVTAGGEEAGKFVVINACIPVSM